MAPLKYSWAASLLAAAVLLTLAGCGGSGPTPAGQHGTPAATSATPAGSQRAPAAGR